jgi:hypothetical protein
VNTYQNQELAVFRNRQFSTASSASVVDLHSRSNRVIIEDHRSEWNATLSGRLGDLVKLRHGWDGYRAQPVSFKSAKFAALMLEKLFLKELSAPSLVPGVDGSLQIEWHKNGYDVELDVLGPNNVHAYRYDSISGEEEEIHLENNFFVVSEWLRDMCAQRQEVLNLAM